MAARHGQVRSKRRKRRKSEGRRRRGAGGNFSGPRGSGCLRAPDSPGMPLRKVLSGEPRPPDTPRALGGPHSSHDAGARGMPTPGAFDTSDALLQCASTKTLALALRNPRRRACSQAQARLLTRLITTNCLNPNPPRSNRLRVAIKITASCKCSCVLGKKILG